MCLVFILSILVISIYGAHAANNTTQFPLCTICTCQIKNETGSTYADVICKRVSHNIYSLEFWQTKDKNETHNFNYHSFNIQNNVFTNLSQEFPPSNLVYLNLANNRIVSITQSVFKNLQNMVVLVLSYNDLDNIDPDAFKVSKQNNFICFS